MQSMAGQSPPLKLVSKMVYVYKKRKFHEVKIEFFVFLAQDPITVLSMSIEQEERSTQGRIFGRVELRLSHAVGCIEVSIFNPSKVFRLKA